MGHLLFRPVGEPRRVGILRLRRRDQSRGQRRGSLWDMVGYFLLRMSGVWPLAPFAGWTLALRGALSHRRRALRVAPSPVKAHALVGLFFPQGGIHAQTVC